MINLQFFPSRRIALYMMRLFLVRSFAVLAALVIVLQMLEDVQAEHSIHGTFELPEVRAILDIETGHLHAGTMPERHAQLLHVFRIEIGRDIALAAAA